MEEWIAKEKFNERMDCEGEVFLEERILKEKSNGRMDSEGEV